MGFSISWIAFSGKPKVDVLSRLSLADTQAPDEANESPASGAELPGGWYVVFLNSFAHAFTRHAELGRLSQGSTVLGCRIEEHVMASAAFLYCNGRRVWEVSHNSQEGRYDISVNGTPPRELPAIHDRLRQSQDEEGGEHAGVDHIFDVPIRLAAALCGYEHDRTQFAGLFTKLVPVR